MTVTMGRQCHTALTLGPARHGARLAVNCRRPLELYSLWSRIRSISLGVLSARADIVLTAPEAGVPLLFIEADNCTEEAVLIARKFDKYARFYQRMEKDTDGIKKPMWRTRWSAPAGEQYEQVHPPVLLVFHQVGKRSAQSQTDRVATLTRDHWQPVARRRGLSLLRPLHPDRGDHAGPAA
ncbi:replication-relaxation family protein [Streptomyces sp. NPDC127033]|uniref:replication-relaxation family protein n=1 Tax=Streptomyces sp. NPDC127033 TaxID=3347110 RepID=UPI00364BED3A